MSNVKQTSTWERQVPVKYECQKGVWKSQSIDIDNRPLNNFVSTKCKVYNSRGVSSHCKHIHGLDYYDKCKVATALRWRTYKKCKAIVQPQCKQWYIIDVNNGQYQCKVKSSHLMEKCQQLRQQGIDFTVKLA